MTANYEPRRNIVRRPDGRPVNVARSRGQLFVCADACCCGRVAEGIAAVPRARYQAEWEGRRLRNIVHLTVGGCLGPCALANVALLLFDGRAYWFQAVNSEETVVSLFDFIEAMLDAGRPLTPPEPLAGLLFTASTWEPRADGLALEDHDRWQRRRAARAAARAAAAAAARREIDGEANAAAGAQPPRVEPMPGGEALSEPPRRNGELVFEEPWQGRAFGMAVALSEEACYDWEEFRGRLIAEIAAADGSGDVSGYYERWLAAFEALLAAKGVVSPEELDERTAEIEFGERDDVF